MQVKADLPEFVETLRHGNFVGVHMDEWYTNWSHLMKLLQKTLVIRVFLQVLPFVKGGF